MPGSTTTERRGARVGSKALIREMNEALVLDAVRRHGTTSRAEITAGTGLSPATITGITAKLLHDGLLIESDVQHGTGGRPARLLQLGTDAVVAAGVRLTPEGAEGALIDLRGEIIATGRVALSSPQPDVVVETALQVVELVMSGQTSSALRGIAVTLSGVVDNAGGTVRHSGALGWRDIGLARMIADRHGGRVTVDNLVNSLSTGLLLREPALAERDLLVFSVGTSIGASLLMDGRIHRGFRGSAGGFAHTAPGSRDGGRACHCGGIGCLETVSSMWGIRRALEARGLAGSDLAAPAAQDVLEDAAVALGLSIANAAKMFGPEAVILARSAEIGTPAFDAALRRTYAAEFTFGDAEQPELRVIPADSSVFARGAAYGLIAELFTAGAAEPTD